MLDAVGSNIVLCTRTGEVHRILPRLNEHVNEEWLDDKARFAVDALAHQRLVTPFLRQVAGKGPDTRGSLLQVDWETALFAVAQQVLPLSFPISPLPFPSPHPFRHTATRLFHISLFSLLTNLIFYIFTSYNHYPTLPFSSIFTSYNSPFAILATFPFNFYKSPYPITSIRTFSISTFIFSLFFHITETIGLCNASFCRSLASLLSLFQ